MGKSCVNSDTGDKNKHSGKVRVKEVIKSGLLVASKLSEEVSSLGKHRMETLSPKTKKLKCKVTAER